MQGNSMPTLILKCKQRGLSSVGDGLEIFELVEETLNEIAFAAEGTRADHSRVIRESLAYPKYKTFCVRFQSVLASTEDRR